MFAGRLNVPWIFCLAALLIAVPFAWFSDVPEREILRLEGDWDFEFGGCNLAFPELSLRYDPMEQGLKERKEKADAIVDARVEALLSGEIPVNPVYPAPHMRQGPPRQGPPRQGPNRQGPPRK